MWLKLRYYFDDHEFIMNKNLKSSYEKKLLSKLYEGGGMV